jgi:hypothetical protein
MLRMMSVSSSRTPGIAENSCYTPSVCAEATAVPSSEDKTTRRRALPTVVPNPLSNGSAVKRPEEFVRVARSTSMRFGI